MFQALRGLAKRPRLRSSPQIFLSLPTRARRNFSIECRGNPISEEDLFRYTNGRFLNDEEFQFSKRYVRFNLEKLCDVITNLSGPEKSSVTRVEKMEGGFSKALLITTDDTSEYIVKIPCPNAGRPMYCTASEVAVLDFIRNHTTIPVPKVLAWNSDASNAVGAEYIIMEKVSGVQIFKKWDEMGEHNRISLIKRLTQWEHELSEIQFPAYGSLYYRKSLNENERISLDSSIDPEGEFCIGPSCAPSWLLQPHQTFPDVSIGPWKTLCDMGEALIDRSFFKVSQHQNKPPPFFYGSTEDHYSLLHMTKKALPLITSSPNLLDKSQPILWHTDLHMGNIFISEQDPGIVTGIIDWQNTSVNPAFLQVRWPVFLTPPEGYQTGHVMPQLPADFQTMDEDEKEAALYNKSKATWTKAYEVASFLNNRKSWRGMQVAPEFKEIFLRCGETWDEGVLPLQEILIEIFLNQGNLELAPGDLPLYFTHEKIERHRQEFTVYQEWHEMFKFIKEMLDTDDEGWIPPERELNEMKSRNKMLFDYYVNQTQKSAQEVKKTWPFPLDN